MSDEKKNRGPGPESTNEHDHARRRRAETLVRHAAADSARDQAACVSAVIGEGVEAHRIVRVGDWTLTAWERENSEPRVSDAVVMERIGYPSGARKFRQRIRDLAAKDPQFKPLANRTERVRFTADGRTRGAVTVEEYLLTEEEALYLISQIDTPEARALTHTMIRVFRLAVRGLLVPVAPHDRVAALEAVAAKQSVQIATLERELASGVIGFEVAEESISKPLRRIASLRSHDTKSYRAELRRYANLLSHYLGHVGRGSKWAMLPRNLLGVAQRHISAWMDESIAFDRKHPTRGQPLLDRAASRPN